MLDQDSIKKEYFELKKKGVLGLLPLPRIYKLEQYKAEIKQNYLAYVTGIDDSLEVLFSHNITFNSFLEVCTRCFGKLNFNDKKNENGKKSVSLAFDFCIISIKYFENKVRSSIDTFWDY